MAKPVPVMEAGETPAEYTKRATEANAVESNALDKLRDTFGALESVDLESVEALDFSTLYDTAAEVLDDWELVDKRDLIGVPFLIVGAHLNETDLSADGVYVNVRCILPDNTRVCFNDGSSGIYEQLKRIAAAMPEPRPIKVKGGLRASVFHYSPTEGVTKDGAPNAVTYYLTSSAKGADKMKALVAAIGK